MRDERHHELSLKANNSRWLVVIDLIKIIIAAFMGLLKKVRSEKLTIEEFGGIEFIQICSLSSSQKKLLWQSPASKKTITILRGKELLYDCLSYKDYCDCYINSEK